MSQTKHWFNNRPECAHRQGAYSEETSSVWLCIFTRYPLLLDGHEVCPSLNYSSALWPLIGIANIIGVFCCLISRFCEWGSCAYPCGIILKTGWVNWRMAVHPCLSSARLNFHNHVWGRSHWSSWHRGDWIADNLTQTGIVKPGDKITNQRSPSGLSGSLFVIQFWTLQPNYVVQKITHTWKSELAGQNGKLSKPFVLTNIFQAHIYILFLLNDLNMKNDVFCQSWFCALYKLPWTIQSNKSQRLISLGAA